MSLINRLLGNRSLRLIKCKKCGKKRLNYEVGYCKKCIKIITSKGNHKVSRR